MTKRNKKLYIVGEVVPSPKDSPQPPKNFDFNATALDVIRSSIDGATTKNGEEGNNYIDREDALFIRDQLAMNLLNGGGKGEADSSSSLNRHLVN